jgi:hypothetical protein
MPEPPFYIRAPHLKMLWGVVVGGPSRLFAAIGDEELVRRG